MDMRGSAPKLKKEGKGSIITVQELCHLGMARKAAEGMMPLMLAKSYINKKRNQAFPG